MWIVVDYSKKLVKSDYFGVIICIWWRRFQKIGIFPKQNAKYTVNWYEDPEYSGFSSKITQFKHFMCRILRKLGTFGVIFPKNWEIRHFVYKILTDFNILVEGKLRKIGIFHNRNKFWQYDLQFYMWFYKGIKVNILATTKIHCSINLQNKSWYKLPQIIAENTENSLNSVPHTIENIQLKNCEKFSPIVS